MRVLIVRGVLRCVFAGLVLLGSVRDARAQDDGPNLPSLSLADLMHVRVEPVFGASKRLQPVTEAPASVTIVTADDIARYGYRTLGDVLRSVRGLYVTYDRNYTYLGARGFSVPGDYNTRILMLVDGHRMNDNIYEQATPGPEFGLDPSTFDRVEIIRGPASSLYGTSAFFAVVNIVTKSGASVNGASFAADAESYGKHGVRLLAGRRLRPHVDALVSAAFSSSDGASLYFPEFDRPETNFGVVNGLDHEQTRQLFARLAVGRLTLTAAYGHRDKGVPTAAFDTVFGDPRFRTTDEHLYVDGQYDRTVGRGHVNLRGYADRYHYDGQYPQEGWTGTPPVVLYDDFATGVWFGAEARVTRPIGSRQTLVVGGEARENARQMQGIDYADDVIPDFVIERTSHVAAGYVQDEFKVLPKLTVNAGTRYDAYSGFSRLAPRVGVIFNASTNQALKYLYGNAFRAPNAYELEYSVFGERQAHLKPEVIDTHEVVWERYIGRTLRTSASAYVNHVARLIVPSADDNSPDLLYANVGRVHAKGMELEGEMRMASGFRGQMSYVLQKAIDADTGETLTNSPRHAIKLLVGMSGPSKTLTSVDVQWMSARRTLTNQEVAPVVLTGLTVRYPVSSGWTIATTMRNVFNRAYADPGSAEHREDAISQDGRTVRVGLEWTLRRK